MARGDSKSFSEYSTDAGNGDYNNSTDTFKYVIVTNDYTSIDANVVNPKLADYTQVASAGAYVANTTLANTTWTRSGAVTTFDADDFSFAANASNPTTGKSILIYNDTSTGKSAICIVDLTTDGGTTAADTTQGLTYTVAAGGIFKVTRTV